MEITMLLHILSLSGLPFFVIILENCISKLPNASYGPTGGHKYESTVGNQLLASTLMLGDFYHFFEK